MDKNHEMFKLYVIGNRVLPDEKKEFVFGLDNLQY